MKKAFIFFSDLVEAESHSDSVPKEWTFYTWEKNSAVLNIFHRIVEFLKEHQDLELLCVNAAYLPDWSLETWNSFFEKAKKNSSAKFLFNDTGSSIATGIKPYMAAFDVKDLRLALEQNYRPSYEDLTEAMSTFGFPVVHFQV